MATESLPIIYAETTDPATYHAAVWDRVFNHRRNESRVPYAVVRASNTNQIISTVKLAKKEKKQVSIRSGGHSWAVWSVRHDAILLDLGNLRDLEYDESTRIVACSPNTTSEQLVDFLATKGRMFAGGHCGEVGLGGFLLGGGQGWNAKNWGHSVEQMLAIDVVTADGEQVHCDIEQNQDLFWLARGGGPAFPGVITRFWLKTRPLQNIYHSTLAWPYTEWSKILPWFMKISDGFDTDTEVCCVVGYPPGSPIPAVVVMFISFKDTLEEAEAAMKTVKEDHPPRALLERLCTPSTFAGEFAAQVFATPHEHNYIVDNAWMSNDADVAALLEESVHTIPNKTSLVMCMPVTSSQRPVEGDPAFSLQSRYYVSLYAGWKDEKDGGEPTAWVRKALDTIAPHSIGSMVSDFDFQRRESQLWDEEKGAKIMDLRRKLDPEGRFAGFLVGDDNNGANSIRTKFL